MLGFRRSLRTALYALTVVALLVGGVLAQQSGGAFLPHANYTVSGAWTFSSLPSLTGYGSAVGTSGAQTLTSKTLTSPTLTSPTITSPAITGATGTVAYEVVTATNAITAAESGKTFFLNSSTEFVSTLPAPAAGLTYTFIVTAAPSGASYTVVTTSSANVIIGEQNSVAGDAGDSGTADDTISFVDGQAVAGDQLVVISDGTKWYAHGISKVAAGLTFTQAS